jgi:hypothetical protein
MHYAGREANIVITFVIGGELGFGAGGGGGSFLVGNTSGLSFSVF